MEVGGRKFAAPLPSQKRQRMLLEEWCFPCWRLPDARATPCRRLPEQTKALLESSLNSDGDTQGWLGPPFLGCNNSCIAPMQVKGVLLSKVLPLLRCGAAHRNVIGTDMVISTDAWCNQSFSVLR